MALGVVTVCVELAVLHSSGLLWTRVYHQPIRRMATRRPMGDVACRGSVKLYSDFYESDIIIASPLALATKLSEDEEEGGRQSTCIHLCWSRPATLKAVQCNIMMYTYICLASALSIPWHHHLSYPGITTSHTLASLFSIPWHHHFPYPGITTSHTLASPLSISWHRHFPYPGITIFGCSGCCSASNSKQAVVLVQYAKGSLCVFSMLMTD